MLHFQNAGSTELGREALIPFCTQAKEVFFLLLPENHFLFPKNASNLMHSALK